MSAADLPLTLYVTSRNSMIGSAIAEEMGASFPGGPIDRPHRGPIIVHLTSRTASESESL
ncbi:MAG: hypothetical protein QOJ41_196 [Acidobacteriaceae bacterium]|jgi:hypothetical protein|nr:hypothetical protein [Acidobacteriaceae bacterium]